MFINRKIATDFNLSVSNAGYKLFLVKLIRKLKDCEGQGLVAGIKE